MILGLEDLPEKEAFSNNQNRVKIESSLLHSLRHKQRSCKAINFLKCYTVNIFQPEKLWISKRFLTMNVQKRSSEKSALVIFLQHVSHLIFLNRELLGLYVSLEFKIG